MLRRHSCPSSSSFAVLLSLEDCIQCCPPNPQSMNSRCSKPHVGSMSTDHGVLLQHDSFLMCCLLGRAVACPGIIKELVHLGRQNLHPHVRP